MKKTLIASALSLLMATTAQAKYFEATGSGATVDAARQNAVTNAIKFSVGEFIVNKEELNNSSFDQKIVSYSNAYVQSIKTLSENQLAPNDFEVRVKVDIESQKLLKILDDAKIITKNNVVNQDIVMEILDDDLREEINHSTKKDLNTLIQTLLIEPLLENKKLVDIEILSGFKKATQKELNRIHQEHNYDPKNDEYLVKIDLKITPNTSYLDNFIRVMKEMPNGKLNVCVGVKKLNYNIPLNYPSPCKFKIDYDKSIEMYRQIHNTVFTNGINK